MLNKLTSWIERVYADWGLWNTLTAVLVVILVIAGLMLLFGINPKDWF
jgi:hypothetical protein